MPEVGADEAAGPGDGYGEGFGAGVALVKGEVVPKAHVAELEEPLQLRLDESGSEGSTRGAERWLEIDLVLDDAPSCSVRGEAVGMHPTLEGSRHLFVPELPVLLVVPVPQVPPE